MATIRPKPYSVSLGSIRDLGDLRTLPQLMTMIDLMFQQLYQDLGNEVANATGGGLTAVVNDTNVTGTLSGTTLTLGWNGTLSAARGGYNSAKVYARVSLGA